MAKHASSQHLAGHMIQTCVSDLAEKWEVVTFNGHGQAKEEDQATRSRRSSLESVN